MTTTLPAGEQESLCTPLAQQAAGDFACRESQLAISHADSERPMYYEAIVEFDPDGSVYKFRDLRAVVPLTKQAPPIPDCVVGTLQRLKVSPRAESVRMPVALTYTRSASPGAQLRIDGTCTIIVPPLPQ